MVTHRIWKNTVPTRTLERLTKYFRLACFWGTLLSRCYPIISPFSPLRRKVFGTHLPKTIIHKLEAFHPSAHLLFPERKKPRAKICIFFGFSPSFLLFQGLILGVQRSEKKKENGHGKIPRPVFFYSANLGMLGMLPCLRSVGGLFSLFFVGTIVHFPISFLRKNPISSFMPILLHFFGDISGDGQIHFSTRVSRCTPSYGRTNLSQFPNPLGAPGHISVLGQFQKVHLNS